MRAPTLSTRLIALSLALALPLAVAQTSEGRKGAMEGTSAGSLAVLLEFIVEHDTAYFAEDAQYHVMAQAEPLRGREAITEFFSTMYGGAFTDTHVEYRTILADGTRVVLEFVYNGTHTGEFMGQPPTGQRVSLPIMGVFEVEGDSIRTARVYYDTATMMAQVAGAAMRPLHTLTHEQFGRARAECQAWHASLEGPPPC